MCGPKAIRKICAPQIFFILVWDAGVFYNETIKTMEGGRAVLEGYQVRAIMPALSFERRQLTEFLAKHHLTYEEDIQIAYGIFDQDDQLAGCGCCAGNLLKCFAVEEKLRGQNALGILVSQLVQDCFRRGRTHLFVVTRPKNRPMFEACGFYLVAETDSVAMLENLRGGVERFLAPFARPGDETKTCGAIVMNCNPFTLGHRALVEYAAGRCQVLHLFVVEEERSFFPFAHRLRLVEEGTRDLPQVRVHPGGPYMISGATFPTYFLKRDEPAAQLQAELDVAVFARRIAPALGIQVRFAGEEPLDPVTRRYNRVMEEMLPVHGIRLEEIPRAALNGEVISASRVRRLLMEHGVTREVLDLVPPCTQAYLKENWERLNAKKGDVG